MTKPAALHVIVGNFQHKLRSNRFPGQILSLAPAAETAGNAMAHFVGRAGHFGPAFPWVAFQCVPAIGSEELHEVPSSLHGKARADADVLKVGGIVEET